jgi:hypothetical protein
LLSGTPGHPERFLPSWGSAPSFQFLGEFRRQLRGTALCAARQGPVDPAELVLAEVWAMRYALLNLFHAAAEAAAEGRQLLPDSVLKIRDQGDARKLHQARKLLEEFFAREGNEGARMP